MNNGKIVLSLGSNMGDRIKNIKDALKALTKSGIMINRVASFYETTPVDNTDQPPFINTVLTGQTIHTPFELLKKIHHIEKAMGRKRLISKGPRNIDIDIIFFDRLVLSTNSLSLPHISFKNRMFVLEPLCELMENYIVPGHTSTIRQLKEACSDTVSNPVIIEDISTVDLSD